jgi:hypothetical protein
MYARLCCHAVLSRLPDGTIVDVLRDLTDKYAVDPSLGIGLESRRRDLYAAVDQRSARLLTSIIAARIPAERSPSISEDE